MMVQTDPVRAEVMRVVTLCHRGKGKKENVMKATTMMARRMNRVSSEGWNTTEMMSARAPLYEDQTVIRFIRRAQLDRSVC